jgi:uncharacterized membrane protein YsdA (DUF1294 family)
VGPVGRLRTDKVFRYKVEKWFWRLMIVPTVLWLGNIVMYVSLLSVYALILAAAAAEEASKKEEDK